MCFYRSDFLTIFDGIAVNPFKYNSVVAVNQSDSLRKGKLIHWLPIPSIDDLRACLVK